MAEQPMPVRNDHPSIQGLVRADLEAREQVGIQRYGTALQPHNGRDALRDAYEEALDLACYLRQAMVERDLAGRPGSAAPTRTEPCSVCGGFPMAAAPCVECGEQAGAEELVHCLAQTPHNRHEWTSYGAPLTCPGWAHVEGTSGNPLELP